MQPKFGSDSKWEFDILDMRVLHFEKLVPLHKEQSEKKEEKDTGEESSLPALQEGESTQETIGKPKKNRYFSRFCSLGYYDQMSYVKAKDEEGILDYKHCFLTKYPYKKGEQRIMTDQMFTLLTKKEKQKQEKDQPQEENRTQEQEVCEKQEQAPSQENNPTPEIQEKEPFEIEDENERKRQPFLGIILVTVGNSSVSKKENDAGTKLCDPESDYKTLLEKYRDALYTIVTDIRKQKNKNQVESEICYKIFYTPNCADLCIVLRTDTLQDIYNVKQQISNQKLDEIKGAVCHTTSYTLFELPDKGWSQSVKENKLPEKNSGIFLELRITCSQQMIKNIQQKLPLSCKLYGITGSGQYSLELDFEIFAGLYPFIWQIKSGDETMNRIAASSELQELFKKNVSQIQCTYMRVKYHAYEAENLAGVVQNQGRTSQSIQQQEKVQNVSASGEKPIQPKEDEGNAENSSGLQLKDRELIKDFEQRTIKFPREIIVKDNSLKNQLREQKGLLKELFYTYNDYWFRQSSWWKGVVFYAQLESVMNGVRQYERLANKLEDYYQREAVIRQTCSDISQAIFSINNFNKLIQSVNQYVVNIPNYEMQTKVNIEKYLMAYTMYLFEISKNYYKSHYKQGADRTLPFFTLDFNATRIEAHTLFGRVSVLDDKETENSQTGQSNGKPWNTLLAVRCPNYQWFANAYHVLPMITHEISHNFRYIGQKQRNEFVIGFLIGHLSKYMMEQILKRTNAGCKVGYYESRERFFLMHMEKALKEEFKTFIETYASHIKLKDIGNYFLKQFLEITGLQEMKYQKNEKNETVYTELLRLSYLVKAPVLLPGDIAGSVPAENDGVWKDTLLLNLLLDLLNPKKDGQLCKEWKDQIQAWKDSASFHKDYQGIVQAAEELLGQHSSEKMINKKYIYYILPCLLGIWKKTDKEVWEEGNKDTKEIKLKEKFAEFEGVVTALEERKVKKAIQLLKKWSEESNNTPEGIEKNKIGQNEKIRFYEKLYEFCYRRSIVESYVKLGKQEEDYLFLKENDQAPTFAGKVHKSMHDDYLARLKDRHCFENQWILLEENQRLLMSLGIINGAPKQFVDYYRQALQETSEIELQKIVHDQVANYEEIFADFGMCMAFQFTAYGYFMYSIHIIRKEREIPRKASKNLIADRIRTLLLSYYRADVKDKENEEKFHGKLQAYWDDLRDCLLNQKERLEEDLKEEEKELKNKKDVNKEKDSSDKKIDVNEFIKLYHAFLGKEKFQELKVAQLDKIVYLIGNLNQTYRNNRELLRQIEILRWMRSLYQDLNLELELEEDRDQLLEELYLHVLAVKEQVETGNDEKIQMNPKEKKEALRKKLYQEVSHTSNHTDKTEPQELWIQKCYNDDNIKDIGEYYNNYSYSFVMEQKKLGRCLNHQNLFVFDYYEKMFHCIQNVKMNMGESKEILDFLFGDDGSKKQEGQTGDPCTKEEEGEE